MHLDGYVDNAFPWLGNYPSSSSPQDRDGAHPTPGTPATPGWILPTPGNTPTPGMPPTPRTLVDPPRPPREGYEWVWFPDGFWAEREIAAESPWKGIGLDSKLRRWKGKSSKSQGSVDLDQSLAPRGSVSRRGSGSSSAGPFSPQSHTPFRTERELVQALQGSSDSSEPFWGYPFGVVTLSTEKKEGSSSSPNSTVKGFRRGSWPGTQTILEEADEDETGLQASTSPLARLKALGRRKEKRKTRSSDKGPLDESVSETSDSYAPAHHSNARKLLSKLSWRKRETPEESGFLSLIEEETCPAQSSHAFWDSVYPGGEARRITTPPLKESNDGKIRSIFTEVDNFAEGDRRSEADGNSVRSMVNDGNGGESSEAGTISSSGSSKQCNLAYRKAAAPDARGKNWFDDKEEGDGRKGKGRKKRKRIKPYFTLNVPEHLPTSPLCPANPKHASGGNGVCVFHGRNVDMKKTGQPFAAERGL